ncbi:uncharacterized protein BO95DRAFT_4399 [Aspergillus brunneoviolaceus CBS 621.78]|uniref:Uncharacterized protein n=1 Tax=Aspergillus brunneoviolaceus CBS 621.78 TaxID=1450534 RepID=A0ACD1GQG2_9EURO|nr:hypothetical protein BO95DRAFT_4399 [Aspergillus brunneoviolaceus CBS 621.78]RAH51477.1 hypothetical protein BO95DRAFT_4399 [Aspergillus brunneoviolaceus CBS 621.78]
MGSGHQIQAPTPVLGMSQRVSLITQLLVPLSRAFLSPHRPLLSPLDRLEFSSPRKFVDTRGGRITCPLLSSSRTIDDEGLVT